MIVSSPLTPTPSARPGRSEMPEPWKTDKWFVSPWCYLPEVRGDDRFAADIKIHDVKRREGGWTLYRLLHHRCDAHGAQSVPRHCRTGRDRRTHGRADDGRHGRRVHARRGGVRGEEGDRSAEEAGGDPLPPGFRHRRVEHD